MYPDNTMQVSFHKNLPNAIEPSKATNGAAGFDLYAAQIVLDEANKCVIVDTGISTAFHRSNVMLIFGRSGLAMKHGIVPANGVGVVDSDYRGPIKVILRSSIKTPLEIMDLIKIGDRVAQCMFICTTDVMFMPVPKGEWDTFDTDRGQGGFGSTGT